MDYSSLLTVMYLTTQIGYLSGYIPQIVKLLNCQESTQGVSWVSWGMWSVAGVFSFLYALLNNGDIFLILTTGLIGLGNILTLSLILFRLWSDSQNTADISSASAMMAE